MRVLLTGATGFLGKHIVQRLAGATLNRTAPDGGDAIDAVELVCMSRNPPLEAEDGVTWVAGDVCDRASLDAALEGVTAVIHAAGKVSHDPADSRELFDLHVLGTETLMDAAKAAGVQRVVYLSTSGTIAVRQDVGDPRDSRTTWPDERADEPLEVVKAWPYYRSKLFAEQTALKAHGPELDVVCLNPSLLLGPGDTPLGQSTQSVRMFFEGPPPVPPPGVISFADVRDVAEAVATALVRGKGGERYLLGSANWTFARYFETLGRMTGKEVPALRLPTAAAKVLKWMPKLDFDRLPVNMPVKREEFELACYDWGLCDDKARAQLDWSPRDPLDTVYDTVCDIQTRERRFASWAR